MLTETVRSTFADRGVVRLDGAFSAAEAARMRDVVWNFAERRAGVTLGDRSTWPADGRPPLSWKRIRKSHAFDTVVDSPAVRGALDAIFGPGGWLPGAGTQVLCNTPTAGPWVLPDGWHMDCGFEQASWPVFAVKLFVFIGEVGPCGGGTMLLPGIHRVVDEYRREFDEPPGGGKVNWHPFLRRHPPLGDLLLGARRPDLGRSMVGARFDIDGVPVDVVELTGAPGDVVLTHLHVFHTAAPNTGDVPRQMLAKLVVAA